MASKESAGPRAVAKGGGASDDKYDRQLRLWQSHGQLTLWNARVCTLGSGPVATEFLKNIVLPGVGKKYATDKTGKKVNATDMTGMQINGTIVIVDDAVCQKRDHGNNFFVPPGSLGKLRGEVVAGTLQELNPDDTHVTAMNMSAEAAVAEEGFFDSYTLVVATQLSTATAIKLEAICRARSIPLIVGRINGLIGYIRSSFEEHTIIESKPSNYKQRLHVRDAWPELKALAAQAVARIDQQTTQPNTVKALKDVPWLLLLVNELELAKKSGFDEAKLNGYSGKEEFIASVIKKASDFIDPINAKSFAEGVAAGKSEDELNKQSIASPPPNYVEAAMPHGQLTPFQLPSEPEFQTIWADERVNATTAPALPQTMVGHFWMMARTLKRFVTKHGRLPVRKEMPDMECLNSIFVQLQNCFKAKAKADVAEFTAMLAEEYKGCMPPPNMIARFCNNAPFLEVAGTPTIATEMCSKISDVEDHCDLDGWEYHTVWGGEDGEEEMHVPMASPKPHPFKMYMLLRVADSFYDEHGYYPGWTDATYKKDLTLVKPHIKKALASVGIEDDKFLNEKYEMEIVRYGGGEIHVTAAFVGGFVAQEAIKLITHQFQPMVHTFIYNGLNGTAMAMDLHFE